MVTFSVSNNFWYKGIRRHFTVFSPGSRPQVGSSSNDGNGGHSFNTLLPLWGFRASLWCSPSTSHCLFSTFLSYSGSKSTKNPQYRLFGAAMEHWLLKQHQNVGGKEEVGGTSEQSRLHSDFRTLHPVKRTWIHPNPAEQSQEEVTGNLPCECGEGDSPAAGGPGGLQDQLLQGLRTLSLTKARTVTITSATWEPF